MRDASEDLVAYGTDWQFVPYTYLRVLFFNSSPVLDPSLEYAGGDPAFKASSDDAPVCPFLIPGFAL